MSTKIKKPSTTDKLNTAAMQAGLILMTAAATLGMVELPEHPNKITLTTQPVFAFSTESSNKESSPIRREREETAPHYISYSTAQRTPGRTGRV